eukprot:GHRQ01017007.1.p2 GENE.GHRQ01017007.1~~GHRQ01017007.1.p2  ORF type:complete len:112 (-),score=31.29 GHRQ01017007.1:695-1030(-)
MFLALRHGFACCLSSACRVAEHQAEKNAPVDVSTAANLAMQLSYNNKNNLQAGLIIAGDAHGQTSVSSASKLCRHAQLLQNLCSRERQQQAQHRKVATAAQPRVSSRASLP